MVKEFVVAYDAREMWMKIEQYFPPQYYPADWLERSLLKNDIVKRLSVDKLVWKSLFQSYVSVFIRPELVIIGTAPELPRVDAPAEYREWHFHAWSNLLPLRTYLTNSWYSENNSCWLIAYSMFGEDGQITDYTTPSEVQPEWMFLGYDVAEDAGLWGKVDGLVQSLEESLYLREKFSPYLNKYQLFTTYEAADEYCKWADQNDPYADAPNYVYGLYHIDTFPKSK